MVLTVDRIEGGFAVCETDYMKIINIPLADLPAGIHEGSVIIKSNEKYIVDEEDESERRAKLFALQNSIFDE
ncbi:MAG: DUF3006 domain-containing protein [Clostridia bacterium]|nr:DUF3006 domain-containing protein [Clostridia bacterium]